MTTDAPYVLATALTPQGTSSPGGARFSADVHPDWTIGGKPNGGYLLAVLGRAAAVTGEHPDVIAASAHYLHSPDPGPVEVVATTLRAGRSATQTRVQLNQDGRACVEALVTTTTLDATTPYWTAGAPELRAGRYDDAVRVPTVNPAGLPVPIMGQVDLRLDIESLGFAQGRPSGRGELWGWLDLDPTGGQSPVAFDPTSLLYAVDAFPPATFEIELTGWVPTLELTAYVRALPAPGPLRIVQRVGTIDAGRVDEQCWVWDCTGRVVAHATQLAGIRLG